jgi:hypothetical protein
VCVLAADVLPISRWAILSTDYGARARARNYTQLEVDDLNDLINHDHHKWLSDVRSQSLDVMVYRSGDYLGEIHIIFPSKLRREHFMKLPYFKLGLEAKLYLRVVGLFEHDIMFAHFELVSSTMGAGAEDERW